MKIAIVRLFIFSTCCVFFSNTVYAKTKQIKQNVRKNHSNVIQNQQHINSKQAQQYVNFKLETKTNILVIRSNIQNFNKSKTFMLQNPKRFVIDVKSNSPVLFNNNLQSNDVIIRWSNRSPHEYRIVIDIVNSETKIYKTKCSYNDCIAFRISSKTIIIPSAHNVNNMHHNSKHSQKNKACHNKNERIIENLKSINKAENISASTKNIPRKLRSELLIAIDAGHGGTDPGTIGSLKIPEKTITLMYARSLQRKFQELGIKTIMTRSVDKFIPLRERVNIARRKGVDLFVSIHVDSSPSHKTQGMTVYTLSSIDKNHRDWNAFYHKEYLPDDFHKYKNNNTSILDTLIEFAKSVTLTKSTSIAEKILNHLKYSGICQKCRHGQQSLAVLRGIDTPSILIEVGYITNKDEELKIISAAYIEKATKEIANAISHVL